MLAVANAQNECGQRDLSACQRENSGQQKEQHRPFEMTIAGYFQQDERVECVCDDNQVVGEWRFFGQGTFLPKFRQYRQRTQFTNKQK